MKTIITTVGTSLFENYVREEIKNDLFTANNESYQSIKDHYKRLRDNTQSASEYSDVKHQTDINHIKNVITEFWLQGITKKNKLWVFESDALNEYASAEIESIIKICNDCKNENIEVFLIATDTVLSTLASVLIKSFFELLSVQTSLPHLYQKVKFKLNLDAVTQLIDYEQSYIIKDLRIDDSTNDLEDLFKQGTKNFVNKLLKWNGTTPTGIVSVAVKNKNDVVFNITGGYKSAVVISTLISQLENQYIPLQFLHENSSQVATIPALPIGLDWGIMELLHPFLDEGLLADKNRYTEYGFDKYAHELKKWNLIEVSTTDETLYKLSVIGTLVKDYLNRYSDIVPYTGATLGKFHEYKIQEYYLDNYQNTIDEGKIVSIALRGKSMSKVQGDYDIVFEKEVLGSDGTKKLEIVACEVKALKKLDTLINKKQLTKYYNNFSIDFPEKNLTELRVIIPILPGQEILNDDIRTKLGKLKHEVSTLDQKLVFSVYTLQVKVKQDNQKIDYQGYLDEKVNSSTYKPFTNF